MTKKHFIALADDIRRHNRWHDEPFTRLQLAVIADFCRSVNPRFDRERWLRYIEGRCGPGGGKIKKETKRPYDLGRDAMVG